MSTTETRSEKNLYTAAVVVSLAVIGAYVIIFVNDIMDYVQYNEQEKYFYGSLKADQIWLDGALVFAYCMIIMLIVMWRKDRTRA